MVTKFVKLYDKELELRKLPPGALNSVIEILEYNQDWKKAMQHIPKDPLSNVFEPKYSNEHLRLIEDNAKETGRTCSIILIDEWSTSGRVRPTLGKLKNILLKAQLHKAAEMVSLMIGEKLSERNTAVNNENGISTINTADLSNHQTFLQELSYIGSLNINSEKSLLTLPSSEVPNIKLMENMNRPGKASFQTSTQSNIKTTQKDEIDSCILRDNNLVRFDYGILATITNNFSETVTSTLFGPMGQIGVGGFGKVFVGHHDNYGLVAIKKTHLTVAEQRRDLALKLFNTEVKNLSQFSHINIVPIFGFSIYGPNLCIVCEYIDGGSLEQKIKAKSLSEWQRITIMIGIANGLKYLHTNEKEFYKISEISKFVHGDVKSANILLTKDFIPKLCDFGLSRNYEFSIEILSSPMGTRAYMAPEGFNGTITQKIDIYSFGIVLLELLTGLRPIIVIFNEKINIKDYVAEKIQKEHFTTILDKCIDNWKTASDIYDLAVKCLKENRDKRPPIKTVCALINDIRVNFRRASFTRQP